MGGQREEVSDLLTHESGKQCVSRGTSQNRGPPELEGQQFPGILPKAVTVHAGFRGLGQQTEPWRPGSTIDLLNNLKQITFLLWISAPPLQNEEPVIHQLKISHLA